MKKEIEIEITVEGGVVIDVKTITKGYEVVYTIDDKDSGEE